MKSLLFFFVAVVALFLFASMVLDRLFRKLDFVVFGLLVSLPWSAFLAVLAGCHGWLDSGLPVLLALGCVRALHGPWLDAQFCCALLLLEKMGFGSRFVVLVALVSVRPVPVVYALLMLVLDVRVGERHLLAIGLSVGVVAAEMEALRVVAPILALLLLDGAWRALRSWDVQPSIARFSLSCVIVVCCTIAGIGGPRAVAGWIVSTLSRLYLEAALLGVLGALGVTVSALSLAVRADSSRSRDRKWFHVIMTGLIAAPLVVFGDTDQTTESIALGGAFAVCALLAVELFRVHSGNHFVARQLNEWYESWLDEKESKHKIALSHIYLVLGCALPFALVHFCKDELSSLAAKLSGVVAVGVGSLTEKKLCVSQLT